MLEPHAPRVCVLHHIVQQIQKPKQSNRPVEYEYRTRDVNWLQDCLWAVLPFSPVRPCASHLVVHAVATVNVPLGQTVCRWIDVVQWFSRQGTSCVSVSSQWLPRGSTRERSLPLSIKSSSETDRKTRGGHRQPETGRVIRSVARGHHARSVSHALMSIKG